MPLADIPQSASNFLEKAHTHFVNGSPMTSSGKTRIDVVNPATGKIISQIADATKADVDAAVEAARRAFEGPDWRDMKPAMRASLLHKFADLIEQNADELAYLEVLDGGKPLAMAKPVDVMATVGAFRYYAGLADKIQGTTHTTNMPGENHVFTLREPIGVAALIVPWNYPLVMAGMKLAPALAAGCSCVLKPAEDTSITALRLAELGKEAGLPDGVFNVITGYGRKAGAMLAEHPGIDKVAFTGSTQTGKAIADAARSNLKKVTLELGGKSPNIIFDDANLEKAVPASAMGVFFNSGQVCTASSRLYVHEKIYDQFIDSMAAFSKTLKVGNGLDMEVMLGPLVSARQFERVSGYIQTGKDEGAEIVCGGHGVGDEGFCFAPTIIGNTKNDMVVSREEIFGPVVVAQKFSNMDEVIALANDTEYGLSSAVFTQDISRAHLMAKRLKAGQVTINHCGAADWDVPIGGYKQSGWGRENGFDGLENYLAKKSVFISL